MVSVLAHLRHQIPIPSCLVPRLQSLLHNRTTLASPNFVEPTVIVGGGIIGLSTAYYLALDTPKDDVDGKADIVVVDPSSKMCAGASGQNEGVIGELGFKDEIAPLAKLAYDLHSRIAADHNGRDKFGYSTLKIHASFSNGYNPSDPRLPFPVKEKESISKLPKWLNVPSEWQAGLVTNGTRSKRLDISRFCKFMQDECERLGVHFLINSTVTCVSADEQEGQLSHVEIQTKDAPQPLHIPCRNLVISAGSWSDAVFSQLFPQARCKIPMAKAQPAQNWLRLRRNQETRSGSHNDVDVCEQVWLAPALPDNEDIHFSDDVYGELYGAGEFQSCKPPYDLPECVKLKPQELKALQTLSARYLACEHGEQLELVSSGRAYLPRTMNDIPIITKLPWGDVFPSGGDGQPTGGVFLNLGHYLDGVTLGPGTGKLMSEIIRGVETSIDPTAFKLK